MQRPAATDYFSEAPVAPQIHNFTEIMVRFKCHEIITDLLIFLNKYYH